MWHWGRDSWHARGGTSHPRGPSSITLRPDSLGSRSAMETWTLPDCSGSCHLMRESRTDTWRLSGAKRQSWGPSKHSGQCHSRQSCCNNNNTIPCHYDDISIYASSEQKTICKLFLGIESDTWLMCHATPVCCTVLLSLLASDWSIVSLARLSLVEIAQSRSTEYSLLAAGDLD